MGKERVADLIIDLLPWRQIDDVKGKRDRLRAQRDIFRTPAISSSRQRPLTLLLVTKANICSIVQVQRTLSVSRTNEKE
jgi:hypothetical protein